MRQLLPISCFAAGALALAGAAHADFVDVAYTGYGAGQNVTVTSTVFNGDVIAAQLFTTLTNSTGGPDYPNLNGNWILYCVELPQTVNGASTTYEAVSPELVPFSGPMGLVRASAIADLYAFANGAQYANDNDYAAAFQVAIWELSLDYAGGPASGADTTFGNFQVSGLTAGAQVYLNALMGAVGNTNGAWIAGLRNDTWQDYIIEIPTPGALALLGLAGLTTGARRRRA